MKPTAIEVLRAATPGIMRMYLGAARGDLPASRLRTHLRRRRRRATRPETRTTLRVLEESMIAALRRLQHRAPAA